MRGFSVWLFSKIVMLIFLFVTLATVTGFMNVLNERATVESANILALGLKDAVQGTMQSSAEIKSRLYPIPERLPPFQDGSINVRTYTIFLGVYPYDANSVLMSVMLAWGDQANTGAVITSASSFLLPNTGITINGKDVRTIPAGSMTFLPKNATLSAGSSYMSSQYRYILITKEYDFNTDHDIIKIVGCKYANECDTI